MRELSMNFYTYMRELSMIFNIYMSELTEDVALL